MKYLQIVLNIPLNQTFTYFWQDEDTNSPEEMPETGKRAEVRFGNRKMTGFIVSVSDEIPKDCPISAEKIRSVTKILDKEPLFTPEIYEFATWISRYYICSIGEAVFSIIPSRAKREVSCPGFSFEDDITAKTTNQLSDEQINAVNAVLKSAEKQSV